MGRFNKRHYLERHYLTVKTDCGLIGTNDVKSVAKNNAPAQRATAAAIARYRVDIPVTLRPSAVKTVHALADQSAAASAPIRHMSEQKNEILADNPYARMSPPRITRCIL